MKNIIILTPRYTLLVLLALLTLSSCDSGVIVTEKDAGFTQACVTVNEAISICPASDMAKIAKRAPVPYEHPDLDWSRGPLQLHAARNETIAFQLIVRRTSYGAANSVALELGNVGNESANLSVSQSVFSAFYHQINNGGYTWGPPTRVLPWPKAYPDALLPADSSCGPKSNQSVVQLPVPSDAKTNQAVWIDTYIPKNSTPGSYNQSLLLTVDGIPVELPITINVYQATLPDKPSINAVGELYRTYKLEGAGSDITSEAWREMSHCYQRLAHQHRMVFIERLPDLLTSEQLNSYADTIDPAMTGELFDPTTGYVGPGANTPVSIWRTPWPQEVNADNKDGITTSGINRYKELATTWDNLVVERNWPAIDYFAYVFDEVDGPTNFGYASETQDEFFARMHAQMAKVQQSIDSGTDTVPIDLLWTSHSNPATWKNKPSLDLSGIVRLWAPNAGAADTTFLQERIQFGDKAWFYHNGHPAVGAHSINASGIEMRTWGVIGARYGFQGQLMWALNLGSDDRPFTEPHYAPDEDRAGNGVMIYPGNQLNKIGYAKSPGPLPSIRLKAWRRGLQDAELYYLALEKSATDARKLIQTQMPSALSEGKGSPSWSNKSADWIDFHKALLNLASQP